MGVFKWVCGTSMGKVQSSFVNLYACSLPSMLTCALTLYNVIGWERFWSNCTMEASVTWSCDYCVVWDV